MLHEVVDSAKAISELEEQIDSLKLELVGRNAAIEELRIANMVLVARLEEFARREQTSFAAMQNNYYAAQAANAAQQMNMAQMPVYYGQQLQAEPHLNDLSENYAHRHCNCIPDRASMLNRLERYIRG